MGIALTDDHRELADVARTFLTAQKARWAARSLLDSVEETRPPFWQSLAELGWLGLHIAEEHGGSGYGLAELVVVVEELGRAVAPGPFVPTVIASSIIAAEGSVNQQARYLPGLVDGTVTAGVGLNSSIHLDNGVATGEAGIVLGAGLAGLLVLTAGNDVLMVEHDRAGVCLVDAGGAAGNLDPTRRCGRVRLHNVRVTPDDIVPAAAESALARARTLLAAEAVGGAADCVEAAVGYAKLRQQFGRTIATFQAVKHHCANMLVGAESA
ncbi:MAG: acyl-CoA/acyl-ACP dehydrogenase, partial [Mycobacteriaceae bacterium]|nr:acyl-CoA/acyl-ACP dehydrogenase [Mycobacteriaceae bacterium]